MLSEPGLLNYHTTPEGFYSAGHDHSLPSPHGAKSAKERYVPLPAVFYFGQQIAKVNLTHFSFLLAVGLYYCFSNLSDARIFIIMYGVTSMYFSAVMVRAAACRAQAG